MHYLSLSSLQIYTVWLNVYMYTCWLPHVVTPLASCRVKVRHSGIVIWMVDWAVRLCLPCWSSWFWFSSCHVFFGWWNPTNKSSKLTILSVVSIEAFTSLVSCRWTEIPSGLWVTHKTGLFGCSCAHDHPKTKADAGQHRCHRSFSLGHLRSCLQETSGGR